MNYENLCRVLNAAAINDDLLIKTFILASTLFLALIPLASSQGFGDSAHSRQFPNPCTSHGNYSVVLCDNVKLINMHFKVSVKNVNMEAFSSP